MIIPTLITLSSILAIIGGLWALLSLSQKAMIVYIGFKMALNTIWLLIKLFFKGQNAIIEDIHNFIKQKSEQQK